MGSSLPAPDPVHPTRHSMAGFIASSGFASGDRLVVGHWLASPIGPFADVMWARPGGERVLLVGDRDVADFVTAVYRFDRVELTPVTSACDGASLDLRAGGLHVAMRAGRGWPIPVRRPAWFTRFVEGPIARATMGVRTHGVSPTGVREWYRADRHRRVVSATASMGPRDLGAMRDVAPPLAVGFSEPPRRPSIVAVRPLLEDPSGRLDEVISRTR